MDRDNDLQVLDEYRVLVLRDVMDVLNDVDNIGDARRELGNLIDIEEATV